MRLLIKVILKTHFEGLGENLFIDGVGSGIKRVMSLTLNSNDYLEPG
jgi:hypothetical protein